MATIYLRLVDEEIPMWRPVEARVVGRDTFEITEEPPGPDIEEWEFGTGSIVRVEHRQLAGGMCLVAVERVGPRP